MTENHARQALTALRIGVAALLIVHGVARMALGIVDDFGGFLSAVGFPFGVALAWAITLGEVVGGTVLAFGRFVRPLSLYYIGQLGIGIALVHAAEGWFVVGAGRNGMEYSALLILVLAAVAWGNRGGGAAES